MVKNNQIRITIPKWIAELKGWTNRVHLEVVPITKDNDEKITKSTPFRIKEVRS